MMSRSTFDLESELFAMNLDPNMNTGFDDTRQPSPDDVSVVRRWMDGMGIGGGNSPQANTPNAIPEHGYSLAPRDGMIPANQATGAQAPSLSPGSPSGAVAGGAVVQTGAPPSSVLDGYSGQFTGPSADELHAMYAEMGDAAYGKLSAQAEHALQLQLNDLERIYAQAVEDGEISIRQAQTDYANQKAQLEQQAYRDSKSAVMGSTVRGGARADALNASAAYRSAGMMNQNTLQRDQRIADIKTRLNTIKKEKGFAASDAVANKNNALAQGRFDIDMGAAQNRFDMGISDRDFARDMEGSIQKIKMNMDAEMEMFRQQNAIQFQQEVQMLGMRAAQESAARREQQADQTRAWIEQEIIAGYMGKVFGNEFDATPKSRTWLGGNKQIDAHIGEAEGRYNDINTLQQLLSAKGIEGIGDTQMKAIENLLKHYSTNQKPSSSETPMVPFI